MTKLACFLFSTMVSFSFAQPIEQGPTLKPTPSEILYRIGDRTKPLVLECATEKGESNVQFSWNKNGKPLQMNPNVIQQENEGTLVFLQPTTDDSGDYQCFGKSEAGVASTRTISVKPTYINAPEVKTVTHKPIEGRPFKLECTIPDSYPKPEIKWMYQFKTDPSISHSVLDKRITQSPDGTLWFSSVTKEDTHENFKYVCLAKTPASDDDIVLAEHIIEDVVPDNSPRDAELEEQYVTGDIVAKKGDVTMIYCIYGGTPLTPPDWYKDGKNMNGEPKDRVTRYNRSAGKRLLIRDTWLEDEGDYTCIVDNEIGQPKKHNMHLTVISKYRNYSTTTPYYYGNCRFYKCDKVINVMLALHMAICICHWLFVVFGNIIDEYANKQIKANTIFHTWPSNSKLTYE
ncbi:hemolin-like [Aricia agestis]|uniref:hemolin-like n=1 Tax=Aricia agestis TaxID=91739 RepID=UPI001C206287|nr:hemolin-like [Aricia agestis]